MPVRGDVRDATRDETRGDVVRRLAGAQKSNRGAAGYSRWVNRPVGRQLAALAYLAGLGPNAVSLLSAACSYTAIVLIAVLQPTWISSVCLVLLLLLGYALDSADGQVARLRGGGSPAGEWLDHVLDAVKLATFHGAVAICWYRHFALPGDGWLVVPLAFGAVASVFFFATILSDMLRRVARAGDGLPDVTTARANPDEPAPALRSLLVLPNDYGVLCLVMVLLAVPDVFRWTYLALLVVNVGYLLIAGVRWYREMLALGRA